MLKANKAIAKSILDSLDISAKPSRKMQLSAKISILSIRGIEKQDVDTVAYVAAAMDTALIEDGIEIEVYSNGFSRDSILNAAALVIQTKANMASK